MYLHGEILWPEDAIRVSFVSYLIYQPRRFSAFDLKTRTEEIQEVIKVLHTKPAITDRFILKILFLKSNVIFIQD